MKKNLHFSSGLSLIYSNLNRMDEYFVRVEKVINNPDPSLEDLLYTHFDKLMLIKLLKKQPDQMERGNLEMKKTCYQEVQSLFFYSSNCFGSSIGRKRS